MSAVYKTVRYQDGTSRKVNLKQRKEANKKVRQADRKLISKAMKGEH